MEADPTKGRTINMKTLSLLLLSTLLLAGFTGCQTASSDNAPQPIRPQGSGGRGTSPGMSAETSSSVSQGNRAN